MSKQTYSSATCHVKIMFYQISEIVADGTVEVAHISTEKMVSDFLLNDPF